HHQTQNVAPLGAQGHANADFLGTPRYRESHNSIDADCSKDQGGDSEQRDKKKQEAPVCEPATHFLRERGELDRGIGSEIVKDGARSRYNPSGPSFTISLPMPRSSSPRSRRKWVAGSQTGASCFFLSRCSLSPPWSLLQSASMELWLSR